MNRTCKQFSEYWEEIGSVLGIRKATIDIIAQDTSGASMMSKILESWLNRDNPEQPLPTWRILCNAIATVDRTAAETISADKGFNITYTGTI